MKRLTIFTPTFNRIDLLHRLFRSVCMEVQSDASVEWLIVDDGSTDGTRDLVSTFAAARPELVRYIWVSNGGKHRALNVAAKLARAEWLMIVDSDDELRKGSISSVLRHLAERTQDERLAVIRGLRWFISAPTQNWFVEFPNPGTHAGWIRAQRSFDTTEVVRVSALLATPFPEIDCETFMAESWLWHRLSRVSLTLFMNEYWVNAEYQKDGLSSRSTMLRMKNPVSATLNYFEIGKSAVSTVVSIKAAINWWRFHFHVCRVRRGYKVGVDRFNKIWLPLGFLLFFCDLVGNRRRFN